MLPKVSIIIPVYNVEIYLCRCIDTVKNQTLKEIEIILVDDESPDECPAICDRYASEDSRIKVIHKKNQGLGLARNSGLDIATGEYVYFVDSDDYLSLDAAEVLYKEAKKYDLDICLSSYSCILNSGHIQKLNFIHTDKIFEQPEIVTVILKEMLGSSPFSKTDVSFGMSAWQGIYKRNWLNDYKLRFPSEREFISEDIIFHLDSLPKARRMKYLNKNVYYHIGDNPISLTHKFNPNRFKKIIILYNEEKRKLQDFEDPELFIARIQRTFLGNVRVCIKQIVCESYNNPKINAIKQINCIVNNAILTQVLRQYPFWKNPFRQAFSSFLIRFRCIFLLYFFTKLFCKKEQNG